MELMQHIPNKSVDMILCDLPYGTTACKWDKILPLNELWKQYKRILKKDGVVVLTASQPFTTDLINSNRDWFRYCWVWDKVKPNGHLVAKFRPMQQTEDILIFTKNNKKYFPQMTKRDKPKKSKEYSRTKIMGSKKTNFSENILEEKYPTNIVKISNASQRNKLHPTQKPVSLFRYLIKTYTNEGELVLDNCIGSGTTAVACKQANRNFIGIELSQEYVDIANKRLQQDNLHAFFQTQGVLTEPSPNRNLKENSDEFSQISANAETSLNSDLNEIKSATYKRGST